MLPLLKLLNTLYKADILYLIATGNMRWRGCDGMQTQKQLDATHMRGSVWLLQVVPQRQRHFLVEVCIELYGSDVLWQHAGYNVDGTLGVVRQNAPH